MILPKTAFLLPKHDTFKVSIFELSKPRNDAYTIPELTWPDFAGDHRPKPYTKP
jgi:hypothetical protein